MCVCGEDIFTEHAECWAKLSFCILGIRLWFYDKDYSYSLVKSWSMLTAFIPDEPIVIRLYSASQPVDRHDTYSWSLKILSGATVHLSAAA